MGTSLKLPSGKTFWIFGDSFIAKTEESLDRKKATFINNSIGLSACEDGNFSIQYFWKNTDEKAESFFHNPRRDEFYWPLASFFTGGKIYVTALRLRYDKGQAFGFSEEGVDLIRISAWDQDPGKWRKEYIPLSDSKLVYPSAEAIVYKDHALLYAHRQSASGGQENVVARVKLNDLKKSVDLRAKIEYLRESGEFAHLSGAGGALKVVVESGNTELSVKKRQGQWLLVQMKRNRIAHMYGVIPNHAPDEIQIATAPSPLGPWSAPKTVHTTSETVIGSADYDPKYFCYAAKLHEAGQITYVCNTMDLPLVYKRMDIYTPRRVSY